jgi:hypothetical protein
MTEPAAFNWPNCQSALYLGTTQRKSLKALLCIAARSHCVKTKHPLFCCVMLINSNIVTSTYGCEALVDMESGHHGESVTRQVPDDSPFKAGIEESEAPDDEASKNCDETDILSGDRSVSTLLRETDSGNPRVVCEVPRRLELQSSKDEPPRSESSANSIGYI